MRMWVKIKLLTIYYFIVLGIPEMFKQKKLSTSALIFIAILAVVVVLLMLSFLRRPLLIQQLKM